MCRQVSLPVRRERGWRPAARGKRFRLWSRRTSRPISPKAHASTIRKSRLAAFEYEHGSYGAAERFVHFSIIERNPPGDFFPYLITTFSWDRFSAVSLWILVLFLI